MTQARGNFKVEEIGVSDTVSLVQDFQVVASVSGDDECEGTHADGSAAGRSQPAPGGLRKALKKGQRRASDGFPLLHHVNR